MSDNSSDVLQFWDEHKSKLPKMADIVSYCQYQQQSHSQPVKEFFSVWGG